MQSTTAPTNTSRDKLRVSLDALQAVQATGGSMDSETSMGGFAVAPGVRVQGHTAPQAQEPVLGELELFMGSHVGHSSREAVAWLARAAHLPSAQFGPSTGDAAHQRPPPARTCICAPPPG